MEGGTSPVCVAKLSNFATLNTLATVATLAAQQGAQAELEATAASDQECDECRQAKDPNEMYGPAGDLLPGQLVNYTIAYENVGEGTAFGVFIVNKLPDGVFDLATLQIANGGSYSAGSKSIAWDVGDLAPKGQDWRQGHRRLQRPPAQRPAQRHHHPQPGRGAFPLRPRGDAHQPSDQRHPAARRRAAVAHDRGGQADRRHPAAAATPSARRSPSRLSRARSTAPSPAARPTCSTRPTPTPAASTTSASPSATVSPPASAPM